MKYIVALVALLVAPLTAQAVSIDLVTVGNPGNASEIQGAVIVGRVTTTYRIAKTEVTNSQYVEFLNAKAASDPFELYNTSMSFLSQGGITRSGATGSYTYAVKASVPGEGPGGTNYTYADKPVSLVSWYDAIRFANWMSNGQGSGSTETGAYTILGGTPTPTNGTTITRNAGATWYLPNENEWYKAAYFNGATSTYSDYPAGTDTVPNNNLPSADTGNSANFMAADFTTSNFSYPNTAVGTYTLSDSSYGTLDQGGNVAEWNETSAGSGNRVRRGGAWSDVSSVLSSATRETIGAGVENNATGFRLAAIALAAPVPGDYNANGVVDSADYVVWRDHLGTSFQLQNEVASTTPGTVTQEDYTEWRARFGNTSGSGTGSSLQNAAVPEPNVWILSLVALTLSAASTNRSRRA